MKLIKLPDTEITEETETSTPQEGQAVEIEMRGPNGGIAKYVGCRLIKMEKDCRLDGTVLRIVVDTAAFIMQAGDDDNFDRLSLSRRSFRSCW